MHSGEFMGIAPTGKKGEIRYMDKLVDELAKGKAMEKILRTPKE